MADDTEEEVLVEPLSALTPSPVITSSTVETAADGAQARTTTMVDQNAGTALAKMGSTVLQKSNIATNRTVTPPTTVDNVPPLVEQQVDGYTAGQAKQIVVISIGGDLVEKFTGFDFLLMHRAAMKDGIRLLISSGFRTYETQARLYAERVNTDGSLTPAGKRLGVAAKPGYSNHQSGIALDLRVNMTVAQRKAEQFSPEFLWLRENAAKFGFDNEEVPAEPWHWRHKENRIVGTPAGEEDYLLSLVSTQASGAAAVQSGKVDATLFLDKAVHDIMKSYERSVSMTRTNRQLLYANMGREAVFRGANLVGKATRHQRLTTTAVVQTPTYEAKTIDAVTFDFDTGLWGDGRNV